MITSATILAFGNGDIGLAPCISEDGVGCLALKDIPPREIGSWNEGLHSGILDPEEFPVIMTFTKIESVDTAIRALETVKRLMLDAQKEEDHDT